MDLAKERSFSCGLVGEVQFSWNLKWFIQYPFYNLWRKLWPQHIYSIFFRCTTFGDRIATITLGLFWLTCTRLTTYSRQLQKPTVNSKRRPFLHFWPVKPMEERINWPYCSSTPSAHWRNRTKYWAWVQVGIVGLGSCSSGRKFHGWSEIAKGWIQSVKKWLLVCFGTPSYDHGEGVFVDGCKE